MANRKSASKQVEGGAPRSPKPQPVNKNRSANTGNPGKATSKPPTSNQPSGSKLHNRNAPKPTQTQPQVAANRSFNGTKSQGNGNGPPKAQGANGPTRGVTSGQDRPMYQAAPRNGPNNPQKRQDRVPVPRHIVPLKPQAPTRKHSQPVTGVSRGHTQKAQNQPPILPTSQAYKQPTNSGKNATNRSPRIQTSTQDAKRGGEPAKGFETPLYNHKEMSNKGHKSSPLLTKNAPSPPPISSAGSKGTRNRSSDSMNPSGFSAQRISSNQAKMSAKPSPVVNTSGFSGWLSSWLPSSGLAPEQATKAPMPKLSKAKGLLNGSRTHHIQAPNVGRPPRKVQHIRSDNRRRQETTARISSGVREPGACHPQEVQLTSNKGNNHNVSAKGRQTQSPGKSAECSPKSSGSKHLSSHPSTTGGDVAQNQQPVLLAKEVFTSRLLPTKMSPNSHARKSGISSPKQCNVTESNVGSNPGTTGPSQKSQTTVVPTLGLGGLLNQVSSFFGWTTTTPREFPADKRVQATNKLRQSHDAAPKPLAPIRQVSKSSKGDDKVHPAPLTSSGPRHSEFSSKGAAFSVGSVKNGPHDLRDRSGKSITSVIGTGSSRLRSSDRVSALIGALIPVFPATLPKEQTPDHGGTSKSTGNKSVRVVSKRATCRTQTGKHQSVRGLLSTVKAAKYTSVPRKKKFPVRSSSSKVLFRAPIKKTPRKGLLRQFSPTLIWRSSDSPKVVSAYSTLAAPPLPSPPKNELQNKVARRTIAQNPDLFKITTPIKVDAFEKKLKEHPNQPFVESVVRALRNGFWPFADTSDPTFPTTYDGSRQRKLIKSKDQANFIQQQRNEEVALGRWSKPFGKKLLPGMHSSPIGAVPKSTPGKYRLIIDQSRGPHSLNSLIPKSQVKVKLDNIHDLGTALLAVRKKHPKRKLTLFKSDVKSAYRQLPIHPSWQIKQVVSIDGQRHVDRCNTFGNRGGGWNWNAFASLVNWIGTEKKNIPDLLGYVDDNFGWEFEGNTQYYRPYKKHLPAKQTRLLKLWDELGIPHDEEKQLSGPCLPILGYEVDANAMTVKVPDQKKAKVVGLLRNYAHKESYTLKELQSVAGSVNAVLCLYPRLRFGLRGLFDEMAGKEAPGSTKLRVTKSVARSLSKLADYLEHAQPIPIRQQK